MADWQVRLIEEIGFHVRVRLAEPHRMDYEARDVVSVDPKTKVPTFRRAGDGPNETESLDEAEVYLIGSIKRDGCSHNTFPGGPDGAHIHGCNRWEMARIGGLFNCLFDLAIELMNDPACLDYLA